MVRPDTVDLFRRHGYEVVTNHFFFKKEYLWTHMMALPGYLGLTESQLWSGPYLRPLKQPHTQLPITNKLRIGIKCNGNPYFDQDVYRSVPIDELLEVLPKNAEIYYFDITKEYQGTISLKERINNWEDTLDYIDQMDIIISSCTSLVHASGALGKRTIVLLPIAKYYVWTSTRTDNSTPWYGDNFTLLEQSVVRSWSEPLTDLKNILITEGYYSEINQ